MFVAAFFHGFMNVLLTYANPFPNSLYASPGL